MGGVMTYEFTGLYLPCDTCRAPVVTPFPADWSLSLRKRDGDSTASLTPHRPDCARPANESEAV